MTGEDEHRATSEAKRQVAARPVAVLSHEAGVARYLGAQHYRERRIHEQGQETQPPDEETEENAPVRET